MKQSFRSQTQSYRILRPAARSTGALGLSKAKSSAGAASPSRLGSHFFNQTTKGAEYDSHSLIEDYEDERRHWTIVNGDFEKAWNSLRFQLKDDFGALIYRCWYFCLMELTS